MISVEKGADDQKSTLMLQKSRMLQTRGVKGEAVVTYGEPLTRKEMRYSRLSRRVENMTNWIDYLGIHIWRFPETVPYYAKILFLLLFITPCHVFYATKGSIVATV